MLRDRGGSYIVGTPRALLKRFEQYLTDPEGHEVQAGVKVKLVPGPNGEETFILEPISVGFENVTTSVFSRTSMHSAEPTEIGS